MKSSDKNTIYQNDKSVNQGVNQNSNVVGFSAFKEKKADEEYKKAINNIIARAQKVDW
ncbi:hypothetical protein [Pseudomonas sp. AA-38]|uniref:hypothetical protein n=1 Tax=Pseudomonas sp. AA-38 TaxID=3028807 RepID=UPI0023F8151E|nr:hypothetical protein [Pseudomonas sp. AA-38]